MQGADGIQVDADLVRAIENFARSTKSTPAEVIRQAFAHYVASREGSRSAPVADDESVYAALERAGLIACLSGGPADLSTNPKHMKDFGRA